MVKFRPGRIVDNSGAEPPMTPTISISLPNALEIILITESNFFSMVSVKISYKIDKNNLAMLPDKIEN